MKAWEKQLNIAGFEEDGATRQKKPAASLEARKGKETDSPLEP